MASIKERLIQFILRGRDELSPAANQSAEAVENLKSATEELNQTLDAAKDARGLVNGLGSTKRAVEQTEATIGRINGSIVDLRDALDKNPDSVGLAQSLKEAERESSRLNRGLDRLKVQLAEQEQAAKAAGIDTGKLAEEEQRLAAEIEKTKAAISDNNQQLRELQRVQAAAAQGAGEHASRLEAVKTGVTEAAVQFGKWLIGIYLVDKALQGLGAGVTYVKDGITAFLKTGDQFELLDKQLASLMGSAAAGEQAVAWIKDFAKNTPLEVTEVTDAFALLKSYGLDPMGGSLQAIVDKNEELGGGMERLTGISSALGQAYAKQKLQTEEILQLVERGVPVWQLLEKVTGKNAAQLQDLATKGKLGRDVIQALITEIGKSAEGAAAASMGTLTGLVSNLSDTWADFLNRIAKSGALDYAKGKLKELGDSIGQMAADGRLDRLAKALSDMFVRGAEKAQEYIVKVGEIDFDGLVQKASKAAKDIGPAIDQTVQVGRVVLATLTTAWNGFSLLVTSTAATLAKGLQLTIGNLALASGQIAGFFGGDELKAKAEGLYTFLGELSDGYVAQAKTDLEQIGKAWQGLDGQAAASAQRQADAEASKTDAVRSELEQQRMLNQAHADQLVANQQRVVDAAAAGEAAIVDMANAVNLIDAAKTTAQLEGLRDALLAAYREGRLSQEDFTNATALLNGRLRELGQAAGGAADLVSDLEEKLGDLQSVQAAITNARTDVDINAIRTALRKLYNDGEITARQYNEELARTTDKQKELKSAVEAGKKSQDAKNASDREAIKTSEELRRESGLRMEAERRAGDQAMQDRRKGAAEAQKDMSAVEDFYGGVMTRAREPLAQLSEAALAAYDKLQGITTVDLSLDTSGLDATTVSLQRAKDALDSMEAAASTVGLSGFGRFMTDSLVRSQRLQVQYLAEKQSLQQLLEGYEDGSISARNFAQQAEQTRSSVRLLNDSDLRTLESAIDSAKDRMRELGESSQQTLSSLQDELDQLQGNQEDIERRRFAGRRRELESQMEEARQSGDPNAVANLQRSLSLLRQIEAETAAQSERAAQQKRIGEVKAATPALTPAAPSKVIRLETARGKSVEVSVGSESDETNLLSILEDAGLRSR
ncbi:tape measure domain-containing protein [Metapseudomonas resinovorans]|uniref:tape measure protein n=1 Tax=Metapseudomonas resinovorans TaxID=53412 RepID=UPI003D1A2DE2